MADFVSDALRQLVRLLKLNDSTRHNSTQSHYPNDSLIYLTSFEIICIHQVGVWQV